MPSPFFANFTAAKDEKYFRAEIMENFSLLLEKLKAPQFPDFLIIVIYCLQIMKIGIWVKFGYSEKVTNFEKIFLVKFDVTE